MELKDFVKKPPVIGIAVFFVITSLVYLLPIPFIEDYYGQVTYVFFLGSVVIATFFSAWAFKLYGFKSFEGKMWALITAGLAFWFVGEFVWAYYDLSGQDPFPSLADVAYLIAYLPIIAALGYKLKFTRSNLDVKRIAISVILVLLLLVPMVYFVALPIIQDAGAVDTDGKPLGDQLPYYYFTTADEGATPQYFIVNEDGLEDVAVNATIVMELDPGIDISSFEDNFYVMDDDWVYVDGTLEVNGTTATFTPDPPLSPGMGYEATAYVQYSTLEKAASLAYPVLDITIFALAILIMVSLFGSSDMSVGWMIFSAGIVAMAVADTVWASMDWQGLYDESYDYIWIALDLLWVLSYLLYAVGAYYQKKVTEDLLA